MRTTLVMVTLGLLGSGSILFSDVFASGEAERILRAVGMLACLVFAAIWAHDRATERANRRYLPLVARLRRLLAEQRRALDAAYTRAERAERGETRD